MTQTAIITVSVEIGEDGKPIGEIRFEVSPRDSQNLAALGACALLAKAMQNDPAMKPEASGDRHGNPIEDHGL